MDYTNTDEKKACVLQGRDEKKNYSRSLTFYEASANNGALACEYRWYYIEEFAWGIVDKDVVSFIAKHVQNVALEICAGKGWLACNMRNLMGDDAWIATDAMCSHGIDKNTEKWTSVIHMNAADSVENFPHANCLVIMWPALQESYAAEAIQKFLERINEDSRVIFWGEGEGGCTGDEKLYELLNDNFVLDEKNIYEPKQWRGIYDYIGVYYPKEDILIRREN